MKKNMDPVCGMDGKDDMKAEFKDTHNGDCKQPWCKQDHGKQDDYSTDGERHNKRFYH